MSEPAVHYDSYTQGRAHLRDLLDAAAEGRPATIRRERLRAAIVDAERLRDALADTVISRAEVVAEAGGWSVFLPGVPVAADGATFDEAIGEMIDALREYAQDWEARFRLAPNHANAWPLVQLVALSDDEQLRAWLAALRGHILRDELQVTVEEFWARVDSASVPARGAQATAKETLPADLAYLLIHRVGLDEHAVASMSKQEAIDRLNRYWTHGT